jgi:hypothetical protein
MSKENFQFLIIVIIVKIKAPLSHVRVTLVYFGCSVFDPSVSCSQNVWIIWLSNLLTLSVPDEGYSERTWWRLFWAYLMKVILSVPDEGYYERTWWTLFQKRVVRTKFDINFFIKEIPSTTYNEVTLGIHDHDCMIVVFISTFPISAYHYDVVHLIKCLIWLKHILLINNILTFFIIQ